jgi:hypothetical protein
MSTSNWEVMTGDQVANQPAHVQQNIRQALNAAPIAEVTVRLYGLNNGQSEVRVTVAPNGPLAAARTSTAGKVEAYAALLTAVQRELQAAIAKLSS